MTTYLSDSQYLAIKPEATPGTAVLPTIFVPLVSENIKTNVNHSADRRMKGVSWKGNDLLRGNRTHEGDIVILCDPDNLGHILNLAMAKGSTTGDATNGYTHPFTTGAGKSYTFEISKGAYAMRLFGVYIEEVKISFSDGQMQATLSITAMGQFSVGELGVALSGSVTTLTFDDNYDINPTRGLAVGDVVTIGTDNLTILTIAANGYGITFTSTPLTYSVGEQIYLKPLTVSNPTLQDPFYMGNVLVGVGVDETAATTAASTRATATPVYDVEISFKTNPFKKNGTSRFDPTQIIPGTREATITLSRLLENENQRTAFLSRTKQAITLVATGKNIKTDFTTFELLTMKFYKVKLVENENALSVGELIYDKQTFEVLYDDVAAKAMDVTLINRTAGTVY